MTRPAIEAYRKQLQDRHDRDEAFIERYRICSTGGRLYTRGMLLRRCVMYAGVLFRGGGIAVKLTHDQLAAVLDDDAWLRLHAGEIPQRVAEAAVYEGVRRRTGVGRQGWL